MNSLKITLALILTATFMTASYAQKNVSEAQNEFHKKIVRLYSFEPYKLSSEQIDSKSVELDRFWKEAGAAPEKYLPLLRTELASDGNSSFFYYDVSKLLLTISDEKQDLELALRSIPKADLKSIQHTDYLRTVHWFAVNGFDTTDAAMRVLDYPDFEAFLVQHSLALGQDYSLIFMLFPMPDSRFVEPLIGRLGSEKNAVSQKSILLALWYAADPDADKAISTFAGDGSRPKEARDFADQMVKRKASPENALSSSDISKLKAQRREIMKKLSDEALYEFGRVTFQLLQIN